MSVQSSAQGVGRRTARAHQREFLADTVTPLGVYQRLAKLSRPIASCSRASPAASRCLAIP